jgi:hypothetical protein
VFSSLKDPLLVSRRGALAGQASRTKLRVLTQTDKVFIQAEALGQFLFNYGRSIGDAGSPNRVMRPVLELQEKFASARSESLNPAKG